MHLDIIQHHEKPRLVKLGFHARNSFADFSSVGGAGVVSNLTPKRRFVPKFTDPTNNWKKHLRIKSKDDVELIETRQTKRAKGRKTQKSG